MYAIADGHADPAPGDPAVVICLDEFGPLNLQPHPGRQWAWRGDCPGERRRRRRATYKRPSGVRHLLAAYDLKRPWRSALRAHQDAQGPHRVPRVLPLHPVAVPAGGAARVRCGQLQPAPDNEDRQPRRGLGRDEQRRACVRTVLRQLAEPDRGAVHWPALLRARRHRPPQPQGPRPHDPSLHLMAKPQRSGPQPPTRRRQGQRCLTRRSLMQLGERKPGS